MSNTDSTVFYSETALKNLYEISLDKAVEGVEITSNERDMYKRVAVTLGSERSQGPAPLFVSNIMMNGAGHEPAQLRGMFVVSSAHTDNTAYLLFTVAHGVSRYDSWSTLNFYLVNSLLDQASDLLPCIPLPLRHLGGGQFSGSFSRRLIADDVFATTSVYYEFGIQADSEYLLKALAEVPSLRSVARTQLQNGLTQQYEYYKKKHSLCGHDHGGPQVQETSPEVDYVLAHYCKHSGREQWGIELSSPAACSGDAQRRASQDKADMIRWLMEIKKNLANDLFNAIEAHWQHGKPDRSDLGSYIEHALRDRFINELLQARHLGYVTQAELVRLYRYANGHSDDTLLLTSVLIETPQNYLLEVVGWYCIHLGDRNAKVCAMTDAGLQWFDNTSELLEYLEQRLTLKALKHTAEEGPGTLPNPVSRYMFHRDRDRLNNQTKLKVLFSTQASGLYQRLPQTLLSKMHSDTTYLSNWYSTHFLPPLGFTLSDAASHVHALIDDALDIRALINPDLTKLNAIQRWGSQPSIADTGIDAGEYFLTREMKSGDIIKQKLTTLSEGIDAFVDTLPTLESATYHQLSHAWRKKEGSELDLHRITVETPATADRPATSRSIIDTLLEHVTRYHQLPADHRDVSFIEHMDNSAPPNKIPQIKSKKLYDLVLIEGKQFFINTLTYYKNCLSDNVNPQTHQNRTRMAQFKADLLWGEGYHYFRYSTQLSVHDAGCISALSAHRQRDQRQTYYYFAPDVYSVSVYSPAQEISALLADCFVITEHGGLQSECAGHAILWTPSRRFEAFQNLAACQQALRARLAHRIDHLELTNCMHSLNRESVSAHRERLLIEERPLFEFELLTGDYLEDLATQSLNQHTTDIQQTLADAMESGYSGETFKSAMQNYLERIRAGFNVPGFLLEVETAIFQRKLPPVLKDATSKEHYEYALILERYQAVFQGEHDYLYGVPDLTSFARDTLNKTLNKDFPFQALDATKIRVKLRGPSWVAKMMATATETPDQTFNLTDYVLTGLAAPPGKIELSAPDATPLPPGLNAPYIKEKLLALDIHIAYQTLLKDALAPDQPEYQKRFKLFSQQLPAQTLESAFMGKLSGVLSETAYRYVEHVLNFPDALARPPYQDTPLIIRPLQLCASDSATPDPVKGMYLIGPTDITQGPLIVWTTYSQSMTFKEFQNEAGLIAALTTHKSLQAEVLKRVPQYERSKYENGGFSNPHVTFITRFIPSLDLIAQGPVSLSNAPILENYLPRLYRENLDFLLEMATTPTAIVETSDAQWFNQLISLGMSTVLPSYVPARLSIPAMILQTFGLVREAIKSGEQGYWGQAISDFVIAFMLVASEVYTRSRKPTGTPWVSPFVPPLVSGPDDRVTAALSIARYSSEQISLLDPYIDHTVSLKDLSLDRTTGVYQNTTSNNHYIVMRGKVYPVNLIAQRWRIKIDAQREGPALKLNSLQRWELDLREPLLGGGPVFSRLHKPIGDSSFPIEIVGMPLMFALRPDKAAAIVLAHETAVSYLTEASKVLKQLDRENSQYAPLAQWLKNHLGVNNLRHAHVDKLASAVSAILGRLLKRSMNPLTSMRYVSGKKSSRESLRVAFVHRQDEVKYIYLDDNFFQPVISPYGPDPLMGIKKTIPPFNIDNHWRAVTLIHEVSHQVLNTEDIAYLNSSFPYPELFESRTANERAIFNIIDDLHNKTLSNTTPRNELFSQTTDSGKNSILKETGKATLDQARDEFITNPTQRVNIILSNADSLAMIIARLGGKIDQYVPVNP